MLINTFIWLITITLFICSIKFENLVYVGVSTLYNGLSLSDLIAYPCDMISSECITEVYYLY